MTAPLLDLNTIAPLDRPHITIDGERYDLAVPGDFGILGITRFERLQAKVAEFQGREEITDEEAERLAELLTEGCKLVVRAPAELVAKLDDRQKLAVIAAFTTASTRATPKPNRATRRTGARSSRGSAMPTARTTG